MGSSLPPQGGPHQAGFGHFPSLRLVWFFKNPGTLGSGKRVSLEARPCSEELNALAYFKTVSFSSHCQKRRGISFPVFIPAGRLTKVCLPPPPTGSPWSFSLSALLTLSLQQSSHDHPRFPALVLVPADVSAPVSGDALYSPVCLCKFGLPCELASLRDLSRAIDFQFVQLYTCYDRVVYF